MPNGVRLDVRAAPFFLSRAATGPSRFAPLARFVVMRRPFAAAGPIAAPRDFMGAGLMGTGYRFGRRLIFATLLLGSSAVVAMAQPASVPVKLDSGDTAWMLPSVVFFLLITTRGL